MTKRNEKTSKRVATIAAKVLRRAQFFGAHEIVCVECPSVAKCEVNHCLCCTVAELKALCASVLTQAPDKPKRKAK